MKKALSILLAAAIMLTLFPVAVQVAAATPRSGTSGGVTWEIDADGLLTLRPTDGVSGMLADYGYWDPVPWHAYRETVTAVEVKDGVSTGAEACSLFIDMSNAVSIDVTNLDTSRSQNLSYMFSGCTAVKTLDLSNFDTSNVRIMELMFSSCSSLSVLDISSFDTSKVVTMPNFLYGCSALREVSVGEKFAMKGGEYFPTPIGTYNGYRCTGKWQAVGSGTRQNPNGSVYKPLDVPQNVAETYVAEVERIGGISGGVTWEIDGEQVLILRPTDGVSGTLATYSVSSPPPWSKEYYDVSGVEVRPGVATGQSAAALFFGLHSALFLNLAELDTSNTTDMSFFFSGCEALVEITLSENFAFKPGAVLPTPKTFTIYNGYPCTGKWQAVGTGTKLNPAGAVYAPEDVPSNVAETYVAETKKPEHHGISGDVIWEISEEGLLVLRPMNDGSGTLEEYSLLSLPPWYDYRAIITAVEIKREIATGKNAAAVFYGLSNVTAINAAAFDTSKATDMSDMFTGCISLREIVLGEKFAFKSGCALPTPTGTYNGLPCTGNWQAVGTGTKTNPLGKVYTPANVPSYVKGTYVAEVVPNPIESVSVSTPTIVESLSAYLNISVSDTALENTALTAYLLVGEDLRYPTPVTAGKARMYIPAAPAAGTYSVVVKGEGLEGSCAVTVTAYSTDIWAPVIAENAEGKAVIIFAAEIGTKSGYAATLNGAAVAVTQSGNTLVTDVDYATLAAGAKFIVKGVKYPTLFPSYSFTFTIVK